MRICICDYSGHPFQAQLSRELARRGHNVLHLHFAEFQTPKARLVVRPGDAPTLMMEAVSLGREFAKYGFIRRRFQEIEIGRRFAARIAKFAPDLVVGCNLPLDALNGVVQSSASARRPFVFWQQDIYSTAIASALNKRLGPAGQLLGEHYRRIEKKAANLSAAIIVISEDFCSTLIDEFDVPPAKIHVIENWAPLDEISPRPKANAWSIAHDLADKAVVLYTGTLGLKHDPDNFVQLAEALRTRERTSVVVASEGPFARALQDRTKERGLRNLKLIPFQPFDVYPDVLGSADILVSILEPDAGRFSVPSKVLSYMCADRAIVLSAPLENLASRTIERAGAGFAIPAGNTDGFISSVIKLLDDGALRERCAHAGFKYARSAFDIDRICDRFISIFESLYSGGGG